MNIEFEDNNPIAAPIAARKVYTRFDMLKTGTVFIDNNGSIIQKIELKIKRLDCYLFFLGLNLENGEVHEYDRNGRIYNSAILTGKFVYNEHKTI